MDNLVDLVKATSFFVVQAFERYISGLSVGKNNNDSKFQGRHI